MKHKSDVLRRTLGLSALLLLFPLWAMAQKVTVKGQVTDGQEPIIGATVKVKGAAGGSITDINGNYTISAAPDQTLVFSYVGYEPKEVKVGNRQVINVTLSEDNAVLNEVVVVGYGQMKRSDLTGSVVSVGEKAIEKSIPTSIDQVLQGRAAGVQIQANTGTPGGSSSIRIRGVNSISSTSQPIFVIDGVIIDAADGEDNGNSNPLASINPSDIVSMDILKDASATAIYGARASNGVIMITTKRGQSGEATITYDGYVGWQEMPKKLEVLNLHEYADHWNNALSENNIRDKSSSYLRPELLGEGTDWQDELFRKALMTNHSLSITGGNDKTTYAISGGYLQQDGIAIGSDYKRQTLRGNIDTQIKKWLKGGINFSLADSKQTTLDQSSNIILKSLQSQPVIAVRNAEGTFAGPEENYLPTNPMAMALIVDNYNKKTNFRINTYLEAEILSGLTFKTELSADYNFNRFYYYLPDYEFSQWNKNDTRTGRWTKTNSKYWSWRNILTYDTTFAKKHHVNVMVGQEMSYNHWEYQWGEATGYLSNSAKDLRAGRSVSSADGYQEPTSLFSYFGRAFYNYDERYLLTATLRRDGSSKFARGNRWGWFPSAALAWRISNEQFLKDNETLTNLKLRLGWGATGNQNIPDNWSYLALMSTTYNTGTTGIKNSTTANPNLKWETTYSTNIGLDLGLWHNRVELVFDWYYKKTKDLLLQADLPNFLGNAGQGGTSAPWANVSSLRNTGVELTVNTVNIDKNGFSWRTNATISMNRNKVLSIDTETGTFARKFQSSSAEEVVTMTVPGKPIGQFWGYKVIGRFDKPEDFYYKDAEGNVKEVARPKESAIAFNDTWYGDYIFEDRDNNDVIDDDDQTFIGNPEPKFTWGFGNTFSWKGFDLTIQFSGSYGNDVFNFNRRVLELSGSANNLLTTVLDYARVEKIDPNGPDDWRNYHVTNPGTIQPRIYTSSQKNRNDRISDAYVEDGSYIRLQNISLSYTLPRKLLQNIFLTNVKIYCNLQNLHTWTKYQGYDPEVGSLYGDALKNGIDWGRYPSPRIYTFGLNVSF